MMASAASSSFADIVVFNYLGTFDPGIGEFADMDFVGTITYDTDLGTDEDIDPGIGFYPDAITAFTINVGGTDYFFTPNEETVTVTNDADGPPGVELDGIDFFLQESGGPTGGKIELVLRDFHEPEVDGVFASDSLPLTIASPDEFEFTFFEFALFDGEDSFTGSTEEIDFYIASVPAPSAGLLGGLGLATMATFRRRLR
jgi:hypothetical protein